MPKRWAIVIGAVLILIGMFSIGNTLLRLIGFSRGIWWIFWPVVLIIVGVLIIQGFSFGGWRGGEVAREEASIPLDGATEASLRVQHGAGRLAIGAGAAPGDLLSGSFGGGLDARTSRDGGKLSVDMRIKERDVARYLGTWSRGRQGLLDWSFNLNGSVPLSMLLETGANETRAVLTELAMRDLRLKTGASSTVIDLPAHAGFTRVSVESGAASVKLAVPEGVAARIKVSSALSGINVNTARFPKNGDLYCSTDWESAANKVEITVETGVGSIKIV
jgi:hypothetical protein